MPEITIQQIYDEIIKNRGEIKNKIESSEKKLLLIVEEFTKKLKEVETENLLLKEQIENISRENKKNNIIIFGLTQKNTDVTGKYICQKLKDLLAVDLNESDLNDFYSLGKNINSPIKVELISYLKKKTILENCHKLKGTNITITHDQTLKERADNKVLRKHLYEAKQNKGNTCFIKKNKLHINETSYTVDDLRELENREQRANCKENSVLAASNKSKENNQATNQQEGDEKSTEEKTETPKTGTIKKSSPKVSDRLRKRIVNSNNNR